MGRTWMVVGVLLCAFLAAALIVNAESAHGGRHGNTHGTIEDNAYRTCTSVVPTVSCA